MPYARVRALLSCVSYVPAAQGSLRRVPRTVAPQVLTGAAAAVARQGPPNIPTPTLTLTLTLTTDPNPNQVLQCLERGEGPPKAAWSPPANISKWVGGAFADHGSEVHYTVGEADREMVRSGLGLG